MVEDELRRRLYVLWIFERPPSPHTVLHEARRETATPRGEVCQSAGLADERTSTGNERLLDEHHAEGHLPHAAPAPAFRFERRLLRRCPGGKRVVEARRSSHAALHECAGATALSPRDAQA